ncbi:MAG TPA: SDR family oxidoreductase [Acidimicrobiia bacterium]|nr:SDR family oxidoreductase [Acidimicrobiia bacterium]
MIDRVLVIGATGHTGRETVRLLVEMGMPVRAVTRDRATAAALTELAGAELVVGDSAEPETLNAAFGGVDKLYLVPPTVFGWAEAQATLIEMARENGVRHIVRISTVGVAPDALSLTLRSHWRGEQEMEQSGMGFTHIRSNSFFQNCLFDSDEIIEHDRFFGCVGRVTYAKVDTRDVASVVALALAEPGHEGRTYTLTGPAAITYKEMAAGLSRALGRTIRYVDLPNPEYLEYLLSLDYPRWLAEEFVAMYGHYEEGSFVSQTTDTIEMLLKRPPRSFDTFATDYRSHFQR